MAQLGKGQAAWAEDIRSVAPLTPVEEKWLDMGGSQIKAEQSRLVETPPVTSNPLPSLLEKLTSRRLAFTTASELQGLRGFAYADRTRLVLHLLNYEVTAKEGPDVVRDVPLRLLLTRQPGESQSIKVSAYVPGQEGGRKLEGTVRDGYLFVQVPEVKIHTIVEAIFG